MTTNMSEVIYVAPVTYANDAIGKWHKYIDVGLFEYIRYDKHEELKAIAEKMAEALEQMVEVFGNDASASTKKSLKVLTEYNKYKGE